MHKAKYSERLTDYVLWRTWREEVSETSLRRNLGKKLPSATATSASGESSATAKGHPSSAAA